MLFTSAHMCAFVSIFSSDVAIDGGKMLLYLYLVGTQQQETLLGTAQIRLADRLEDNKSETHWLSFSSKSTDELDPGCIRVTTTYHKPKTSRIGPKDFKIVKVKLMMRPSARSYTNLRNLQVLGKGVSPVKPDLYLFPSSHRCQSFGTVYQVRKQESGRSCTSNLRHDRILHAHACGAIRDSPTDAMKVLSKTDIAKRKMSPHVLSERKILQMTHLAAASVCNSVLPQNLD